MARRARQLAGKLDKTLEIQIDVPPLRLARERWGSLWTACIHLITNAVDHGIEPADAREAADKQPNGQLSLSAHDLDGEVVIRVRDDGRGIDWARVSEKAEALGLPAKGKSALQDALFATGMSTRDNVTTTSGRGVGLSALAAEAHALGGRIEVESTLGEFTEFRIRVPKHAPATAAA
ncbi:MAG: ATP-binding protein [bacterium]|nr:ATP-binding protein [bacterium]